MEIELMRAGLPVQNKTVPGRRRDELASRQAAQVRVADGHASDDYGRLRFPGNLHLIGGVGRQGLTPLTHALHTPLNHLLDVLESFLLRIAPGGAALSHQRWTVCVPTLSIRLYHDSEVVGLHRYRLL